MAETCLHGETDRHYYSDQPGQPLALCGGGQCDHFNTMTASGQPLNPLRCTMRQGHGGNHSGGGTTWSESLGERAWSWTRHPNWQTPARRVREHPEPEVWRVVGRQMPGERTEWLDGQR